MYAQSWQAGTHILYTNPDTTKVGIGITNPSERLHINNGALKIGNSTSATDRAKNLLKFGDGNYVQIGEWEADDMLSFKASRYSFTNGVVGIGTLNQNYKLSVNGKVYLGYVDKVNNWGYSYLNWESNGLWLGTPQGTWAHNSVDIRPGGCTQDTLQSIFRMYNAPSPGVQELKIQLQTKGNCWFNNNGNVGIGTSSPVAKLDVRGAIRANEIYVNTVGADFVFDEGYNLRPLQEVKSYIENNHHLPEIPSATEMQEEGVSLDNLVIQLLQKVEELTLYTIQQEERIKELENTK
ncbi:MAG: hypothetical protein IJ776_06500 [Paludibacteraceae bacterium]|nr:hypothetical protein [Paludibacteraceae bacterium]